MTGPWDPIWTSDRANVEYGVRLGKGFLTWRRKEASPKEKGPPRERRGFYLQALSLISAEGNLTCIAKPYLRPRGSPGARG